MNLEHARGEHDDAGHAAAHDRGTNGSADDPAKTLAQVRDILFGKALRTQDEKRDRLADEVRRTVERSRLEASARLDELAHQVAELRRATDERIDALEGSVGQQRQTLRDELTREVASLRAELDERASALERELEREADDLRARSVERGELGQWLSELGQRVAGTGELDPDDEPDA